MQKEEKLCPSLSSKLEWIITGTTSFHTVLRTLAGNNMQLKLDVFVQQFWSLDSVPELIKISEDEQDCEDHFKCNYFRDRSGRFVVKLPFKDSPA